ncbi:MAG: MFS transporter [Verrucomicrobiia bacterium]|jgi:MFS family permease
MQTASPPNPAPTHARQWVIFFAVSLAVVTYVDRACIWQAAGDIQRDLGFNKEDMSLIFAAFSLAYGLFEIPGGWMGDRFGPRTTLMRVVLMWSLFTAATGWAWNWISMVVCRFFFGAGEAGCFPNLTKVFSIWLPKSERVRAQGIMWLSARWGGAFTPLLVVWVLSFANWRVAFMLFGTLGIIWAVFFYRWFRDDPRVHPSVNAAELALLESATHNAVGHGDVPWRRFMGSGAVWLLWLQYFCINYAWYSYISWLPTYLRETSGLTLTEEWRAMLAGLPLFFGGLGSLFTGVVSERLALWLGSTAQTRRVLGCVGFAGAAAMLGISTQATSPLMAMVLVGLAAFANDLSMPGSWAACMDVGGRYAGSLSGSMNMVGQIGSALGPVAVAQVLKYSGNNWAMTFWMAAAVYAIGAVCWLFIDPVTPLDGKEPAKKAV